MYNLRCKGLVSRSQTLSHTKETGESGYTRLAKRVLPVFADGLYKLETNGGGAGITNLNGA